MEKIIDQIHHFFSRLAVINQRILDAQSLGKRRQLREAISKAKDVLRDFHEMSWIVRLIFSIKYPKKVSNLEVEEARWNYNVLEAIELSQKAFTLALGSNSDDLYETTTLSRVVYLLEQSTSILHDVDTIFALEQKKAELKKRQSYTIHTEKAKNLVKELYFREALHSATEAQTFITSPEIKEIIEVCHHNIPRQAVYERILKSSKELAAKDQLQPALVQLKHAQGLYPRADGQQDLASYEQRSTSIVLFKIGLAAELSERWLEASHAYQKVLDLYPSHTTCRIRLAITQINQGKAEEALSTLTPCTGSTALYLRGYAQYAQGKLVAAYQIWQGIPEDLEVERQKNILQEIRERDRLSIIARIEQSVQAEDLETAKVLSQNFTGEYGHHETIQKNLNHHIEPRLTHQYWKTGSLKEIFSYCQSEWKHKKDLPSLHNLAIVAYYQAKQDPGLSIELVPFWSSLMVNLKQDPILDNISWLSTSIDHKQLEESLQELMERLVHPLQEANIQAYLAVHDLIRWDLITLKELEKQSQNPPTVGHLKLSPSLYSETQYISSQKLYSNNFSGNLLDALYSLWGKCLAAFLDGDPSRAISIKPSQKPQYEREHCAVRMIAYHEGTHWLKQDQWRRAKPFLITAKPEILAQSDWTNELEGLFEGSLQQLSDLDGKIEFIQFWYDLLSTSNSKSYLVEHKASEIAKKVDSKHLSLRAALKELNKLKSLDTNNVTLLNIIQAVEIRIELEEINSYINRNDTEGMAMRARRSKHQEVRFIVAEILSKASINASLSGGDPVVVQRMVSLAHDLCPHEPAFQSLYAAFGLK